MFLQKAKIQRNEAAKKKNNKKEYKTQIYKDFSTLEGLEIKYKDAKIGIIGLLLIAGEDVVHFTKGWKNKWTLQDATSWQW